MFSGRHLFSNLCCEIYYGPRPEGEQGWPMKKIK